ncbi:hypothetical protein [Pseudomonas mandelii]|uniref:hypothetical protein n=1 Tax=Pseudomonas mandelii TaxID=75612 RepID=UPI003C778E33
MGDITWDAEKIRALVHNAKLYSLDMSRGKIEVNPAGGFWVHLDQPLFTDMLGYKHVSKIMCHDASVAEAELLYGLHAMQKAERLTARLHRVYGWDMVKITRTPLTKAEVDEYRESAAHARKMARYAGELRNVLERGARVASESASLQHLQDTYGLVVPAQAAAALPATGKREAPNAVHRRSNGRK